MHSEIFFNPKPPERLTPIQQGHENIIKKVNAFNNKIFDIIVLTS